MRACIIQDLMSCGPALFRSCRSASVHHSGVVALCACTIQEFFGSFEAVSRLAPELTGRGDSRSPCCAGRVLNSGIRPIGNVLNCENRIDGSVLNCENGLDGNVLNSASGCAASSQSSTSGWAGRVVYSESRCLGDRKPARTPGYTEIRGVGSIQPTGLRTSRSQCAPVRSAVTGAAR